MSWWDYGYQITAMGNRTVIVDNNTWNNTHIATVGRAMSSYEDEAYEIMRSLDVDYVLVVFGGVTGYSSDDINNIGGQLLDEHLLIVCELLKANLYEFHKFNRESGGEVYFTMPRLQDNVIFLLPFQRYLSHAVAGNGGTPNTRRRRPSHVLPEDGNYAPRFASPTATYTILSANQTLTGDQTIISANEKFELGFFTPGQLNLWESFDNPTDTWMPEGKIAYNKRTQKQQLLSCWRNSEDPSPGLFTHEIVPNGSQYISRWNMSEQYWTSGSWNGHGFDLVPEMSLGNFYNFTFVDNENESYFTYSLYDRSILARFVLDVSGQVKMMMWIDNTHWTLTYSQPKEQCDVYGSCGVFGTCNLNSVPFCDCSPGFKRKFDNDWDLKDYSGGCVREIDLQCENNGRKDKFLTSPNLRLSQKHSQSLAVGNLGECESACLSNCSCTTYAYDENRCSIWNDELLNMQKLSVGDGGGRTIFIRLSASSSVFSHKQTHKWVLIGAIMGSFALVLVILAVILNCRTRRRRTCEEGSLAFGYTDLQNATKNFSNKLGGGDSHIFNASESKFLDWKTRYTIALGIARGLAYLHEKCRDRIIHCDIKPENILLDGEFCPKVGDFGLAKLVGRDFSRVLTTMRGTRGYLAPEWMLGVAITTKADVYSYGMMLFEILSGRRNLEDFLEENKNIFFPCLAASVTIEEGDVLGLLDPLLDKADVDVEEVSRLCRVACWCIQDDESIRPSMGRVVGILERVTDVNMPPMPRLLRVLGARLEEMVLFTNSSRGVSSLVKSTTSSGSSIEMRV
ncbi:hypothetical protein BUALT_Bualt18G0024300 [Buddleja alternifolia]|uniref:non-specific serine/threonine protein kinase n=1 Tax=Buddleja alternifolia TaxID=168488 RepID=A0AAV6W3F7_9LAMI|nr:hypothetical protein BUALT_Bualt18G0024300 [Buddleja alternifolia]